MDNRCIDVFLGAKMDTLTIDQVAYCKIHFTSHYMHKHLLLNSGYQQNT